jgi:hypothetical protein
MDSKTLLTLVEGFGGREVPADDVFTFSLPVNKLRDAIPKLGDLGVECRKQQEFVGTNPRTGKTENIVHLKAYRRPGSIGP